MKQLLSLIILLSILSCGRNAKEQEEINKNVTDVMEVVEKLPEIKKEIDKEQAQLGSQEVTGVLNLKVNGTTKTFKNWNSKGSSVRMYPNKANYIFRLDDRNQEYLSIEVKHESLWTSPEIQEFAPTMFPVDFTDQALMKAISNGYVQLTYINKVTNEEYLSGKGILDVKVIRDEHIKIYYSGEGFSGDWKEKEYIPLEFNVDLSHNFISTDSRDKS